MKETALASESLEIKYFNKCKLTVILKEKPHKVKLKNKLSALAETLVVNVEASWNYLGRTNYVPLSIYNQKKIPEFLKLTERDIITIEGIIHNIYFPNKPSGKRTFFHLEVLKFKKVGKKRK